MPASVSAKPQTPSVPHPHFGARVNLATIQTELGISGTTKDEFQLKPLCFFPFFSTTGRSTYRGTDCRIQRSVFAVRQRRWRHNHDQGTGNRDAIVRPEPHRSRTARYDKRSRRGRWVLPATYYDVFFFIIVHLSHPPGRGSIWVVRTPGEGSANRLGLSAVFIRRVVEWEMGAVRICKAKEEG